MKFVQGRKGERPATSVVGAHRQVTQQSSPEMWGRLVARATAPPHVVEGHSTVSLPSTRALFFDDLTDVRDPSTSLASNKRLEPVHLHGVKDTSLHLCLSQQRVLELCVTGWGEVHAHGDHGTEMMIYGPRDDEELDFVVSLITESLAFARDNNHVKR